MKFKVIFAITVATGIGLYTLPSLVRSCVCTCKDRMDGKTVLITGGSDGIGRETAVDLARRGARVIIAARNVTKLAEAAEFIRTATGNANVVAKELDLASFVSIRAFATDVMSSEDHLHVLVNNAGIMGLPCSKTADGFEMHFGVNHLGHFLLTNLLLDLLTASAPSRVVVVSSAGHFVFSLDYDHLGNETNPWIAYCKSKLANVLFARELAKRVKGTGVSVFAVHPGTVHTALFQHVPAYVSSSMRSLFSFLLKTPTEGAQTSIHCAVCPGLESLSGSYFSDCTPANPSTDALNEVGAARLWMESERLVGLAP